MKKVIEFLKKYRLYVIFTVVLLLFIVIFYNNVYDLFNKSTENLTVTLNSDSDYYEWFSQFDELYNKKKNNSYPSYSVNKDMFLSIYNLLNSDANITYDNGKYFINNNEIIELDCNTQSFKYVKSIENNIIEIIEVNLSNGKYYIQLIKDKVLYKITLNKDSISKKEKKINDYNNYNSIYGINDFKWQVNMKDIILRNMDI